MKTSVLVLIVIGIILFAIGAIFVTFFGIGTENSTIDKEQEIGMGEVYVVGGKSASKIVGEFSSELEISVHVTADEDVRSSSFFAVASLDDYETLVDTKTKADFDYDTPSNTDEYYLLFENKNLQSTNVDIEAEFQSDILSSVCLLPGIILVIIGLVLLILAGIIHKKSKKSDQQPDSIPQPSPAYPQYPQYSPSITPTHQTSGPVVAPAQPPPDHYSHQQNICQYCKGTLTYDPNMQRWYCYNCHRHSY
ncbi:MAG: hypothetical protein KAJ51_09665 [Thermoplasmata archaeon]|nr:hypothetical protein [Thermoplasmata archaeon]